MSGKVGHVAVVTGGTGFVATHLVSQLLSKGYGVRATVRHACCAAFATAMAVLVLLRLAHRTAVSDGPGRNAG